MTKTEAEAQKIAEAIRELPAVLRGVAWTLSALALRMLALVQVYGVLVSHGAAPALPWQAVVAVYAAIPLPKAQRIPTDEVPPRAWVSMVVSLGILALCWAAP
jgi:predicted anti-sigma-YlaC factor YlaD